MAHGGAWYGLPSLNVAAAGTPTWAVGTADAEFPLANSLTLEPDVVAKANENTATYRLTLPVAKAIRFIAFFNVNCPGVIVTLTNNAGMVAQTKTVPSPEDGLSIHVFFDLTDVASVTATQWNLAVVGSRPVTIGTVTAYEELGEFRMRWDYSLDEKFPVIEHRTGYDKRLQYRKPVRGRRFSGQPFYAEDRNALRTLRRETLGSMGPFTFVPDLNDDDVLLTQFASDTHQERTQFFDGEFPDASVRGIVEHPITLEEVSSGVSLL
jgi:hypothetical protein